jgi:hypothetical protein
MFKRFDLFVVCVMSVAMASCGKATQSLVHAQVGSAIPINLVMQTIREYGRGKQPLPPAAEVANPGSAFVVSGPYDFDGPYQSHIGAIFTEGDFAQLEKEAYQVRNSRSRLRGGVWKLFGFYDGVAKLSTDTRAADSDWDAHLVAIKKWISTYPDSATARIALAETYINYKWVARGNGYANSVSESGWSLFHQRVELGKAALVDAARVRERCPYWYEAMQQIALAEGWDKQQARELLDRATAFEPTYYHFYREYANFLLPKWYGEEGETQAFAEEVSKRVGDPNGSIIYFEIASQLACQCDKERNSLAGMSWPRVKQGYAELQQLYGTSNMKTNRFAYMSFLAEDKASARDTFSALGDSWNRSVWQSADNFESAKKWASTP